MVEFNGEYEYTGLDALTVLVRLGTLDPLTTRCKYLRRLGSGSNLAPQNIDQCAHCMLRSYAMIAGEDKPEFIVNSMARGRTVVYSIEPYEEGEVCKRCTEHRSLFSFTDRLLGGAT